jgi:hypothetical protein
MYIREDSRGRDRERELFAAGRKKKRRDENKKKNKKG